MFAYFLEFGERETERESVCVCVKVEEELFRIRKGPARRVKMEQKRVIRG